MEIVVAYGTDLTNLVATFTLSPDATATVAGTIQESRITPNNFTNPVTYAIMAKDGSDKNWIVIVTEADPPTPASFEITEIFEKKTEYEVGTNATTLSISVEDYSQISKVDFMFKGLSDEISVSISRDRKSVV